MSNTSSFFLNGASIMQNVTVNVFFEQEFESIGVYVNFRSSL